MRLNLYSSAMERVAVIGGQFISCLWTEGYNTVEPFALELPETDFYRQRVRPDCYVGRSDRKSLMVIKSVRCQGGRLIANGFQAGRCLEDVAFIGTIPAGSDLPSAIQGAYETAGGYEGFSVPASDLCIPYDYQISNRSVLELCRTMCQETDTGFRVVRGGTGAELEFYRPEADPDRVLSRRFGTISDVSVTLSTQNLKNHAIVLGAGEGEARAVAEADLSGGGQKRSLIVDARDLTREDGETEVSYLARLEARGREKLLERCGTWECAFVPLAGQFGRSYELGDVLTVLLPEYGLKLRARVVRFTQKEQNNQTKTTVEVGTITIVR